MAKVILDTNFILNCVRNKFDFYEGIRDRGDTILIPKEVIEEIKRISKTAKSLKLRDESKLSLKVIKSENYDEVDCPGRYVDSGIKKYLNSNPDIILATMDRELKKSVKNRKIVIRNKKKLELQ